MRFEECLPVILGHEGGYSNVIGDRGGVTNYGITQKTYSAYLRSIGMPDRPVSEIHQSEIEAIYFQYWKDASCARLPEPLDLLVFDCAVNSGAGRAVKLLQKALGVDADGVIGSATLDAIREEIRTSSLGRLCMDYLNYREDFYLDLVDRDASQKKFLKGWQNRLDHLRDYVSEAVQ